MMTWKRTGTVLVALGLGVTLWAAPEFEKVPEPAREALRGVRGKPISSGLVFVNGKLLQGPYTVARFGTAIYVNNRQVTGQVVPWRQFLGSAQDVSTASTVSTAPAAAEPEAPAAPAKAASSLDDLFDDAPAESDKKAKPKKVKSVAAPMPTGPYHETARTKVLLKRINDTRTAVDRRLRGGAVVFFGSRYSRLVLERKLALQLLAVMPEAMNEATNGKELMVRLRAKGIAYVTQPLCDDLMENAATYTQLVAARAKYREAGEFESLIGR